MFITLPDPCYNESPAEPKVVTEDYEDIVGKFPTEGKICTGIIPFQHFCFLQDKLNQQPEWKAREWDDVLATSAIQIQLLMK